MASPPPEPSVRGRRGRDLLLIAAASLIATVPVWLPTLPPMTDLPDHAAQVALLRALRDPGFPYAADFTINAFTPYWIGYALVYALVPVVGMIAACRLVISLALAALPFATALVLDETGLDRRWALLVIPAMFGFSYHWGFLNFLVAAPLGLVFVRIVLQQTREPTASRAVLLAGMTVALFFCHALICAFFGAIAGVMLLVATPRTPRAAARRVLPLVVVVPVAAWWLWGTFGTSNPHVFSTTTWDLNWWRTSDPIYALTARTHGDWSAEVGAGWGRVTGIIPRLLGTMPSVWATMMGLAVFALPVIAGARPSRSLTRWVPGLIALATLLFAPSLLLGIAFTYQRFTVFAVPVWLIALDPPPAAPPAARAAPARMRARASWPAWTWPACLALAAVWIGVVCANARRYDAAAAGFPEILSKMQPGARVLSLVFDRDSPGTIAPPFLHYPVWYAALRGGIVDPSATGSVAVPVTIRPDREPLARVSSAFEWNPGTFSWTAFEGSRYRYIIVRADRDVGPALFPGTPLIHHVGRWWLYEHNLRYP